MCEVVTAHISWDHVESESVSRSFVSNSLQPHGLRPARFLWPWNSPGKNTGVGCHSFLQGSLPDSGTKLESPILQADSLLSEPPGKPRTMLGRSSMSCWGETLLHGDWMVSTWLDSYARGSFWKQKNGLEHCSSNYGPRTMNIRITWKLLIIQILASTSDLLNQTIWVWGPKTCALIIISPQVNLMPLKFENHWIRECRRN